MPKRVYSKPLQLHAEILVNAIMLLIDAKIKEEKVIKAIMEIYQYRKDIR